MISAAVVGATGYTGSELIGLLHSHPQVELVSAVSKSHSGESLASIVPSSVDVQLVEKNSLDYELLDVLFLCLPHGASIEITAEALAAGVRVVDLSADFRLKDGDHYPIWYGVKHSKPHLLEEAVYGLTEIYRSALTGATLVANPGCYPTSILLALYPLIQTDMPADRIIIDAKSGVSGAGRTPRQATHFVEVAENLKPYNIGRQHRHLPEIEQMLSEWGAEHSSVIFAPHLIPTRRGLLATIYLPLKSGPSEDEIIAAYQESYSDEPFIQILGSGQFATLAHVNHTNDCAIGFTLAGDTLVVTSTIDNLLKGAAGQAVQNMNVMFGLDESLGLPGLR